MAVSSVTTTAINAWAFPGSTAPSPRVQSATLQNADDDQSKTAPGDTDSTERNEENNAAGPKRADGTPLEPQEIQQLNQLKQIDREVRQHEQAHQTVGGAYTGSISYEYEIGPDGKRYAVAGEVPIDYGPVPNDPQATIDKMQIVIAAAMAPADPSPKDYQVAAQARQYLLEAKLEAAMLRSEMDQARNDQGTRPALNPEADSDLANAPNGQAA